jgi:hypothetical protein
MAGNLTHARALLALAPLLAGAALANPLADPTRPPTLAAPPRPAAARPPALPATPASATPAPATAALEAPPMPQLQGVHLPNQGPPTALVDGKLLRPGDRLAGPWGERQVQAIDHQGLLLAQPGRAPLRLWLLAQPPGPAAGTGLATAEPKDNPAATAAQAATVATRSKP